MNLEQLRYFVTVAQLENISRAAEVFHLSQSSLSKNIMKLESELGTPLFERNGKRITLNAAGTRFLEGSLLILQEADRTTADLQLLSGEEAPTIRIGFAGRINDLIKCISRFRIDHPFMQFDLVSDIEWIEHLDINDFDVLIYPDEPRYTKFSGYSIGEEKYFFAVSTDSDLAKSAVASPALMQNQHFVFMRRGINRTEYPFRICSSLAVNMRSQSFADSRGAHRRFIATGMAVGFVPEGEARAYSLDRRIRLLPILDKRFARPMMLCFKRDKHLSESARDFKELMLEEFSVRSESL